MQPEYKPVPVAEPKRIATEYEKDIVVVLAYDIAHGLLHTTTFGKGAQSKVVAAAWGDQIPKLLGADVAKSTWYEDFRATEAAEYKRRIDELEAALAEAKRDTVRIDWLEAQESPVEIEREEDLCCVDAVYHAVGDSVRAAIDECMAAEHAKGAIHA